MNHRPAFPLTPPRKGVTLDKPGCFTVRLIRSALPFRLSPEKGGDPAAGSPTATLLRLHPSHQPLLRRLSPLQVESATSGAISSHDVTGGVYKARERIQGVVADTPLLAIPASCSRVADCNLN